MTFASQAGLKLLQTPSPGFGSAATQAGELAVKTGSELASDLMLNGLLNHVSAVDHVSGQILKNKEHTDGLSWMKFAQDTAINWLPKFMVSRSGIERLEASFVEFVESAYFYFVAPYSAQHGFSKLFQKLSPDKDITRAMITTPMKELAEDVKHKVMPIKLATWISSVGTLAGLGTYGLNFVKNLMTDKIFKKNEFSDIVKLKGISAKPSGEDNDAVKSDKVAQKAIRRLKQVGLLGASLILGSAALARYGSRIPQLKKPLGFALRHLDFQYGKNGMFGLSESMLPVIIGMAIVGYIDAARDNLERWEVAVRTPITGGYLMFGASMIERATQKILGKHYPNVFMTNSEGKQVVKSLKQLGEEAIAQATELLGKEGASVGQEAIQKKAAELMLPNLKGKSVLFWGPNLFSMGVVGFMVAIMNQQFTKYRYQKALKEQALTASPPANVLPFTGKTSFAAQKPSSLANNPFAAFGK